MLVAEDDPNLGTILKAYLTQKGYTVFLAVDGQSALDSYQNDDVDACILDIMMPVKDGFTVAKEIRRVDKRIPIIFLTAKNLEADKLKGFEIGADDYVTKPFAIEELLARIRVAMKKRRARDAAPAPVPEMLTAGPVTLDLDSWQAKVRGETVPLTRKEFDTLKYLMEHAGKAVTRDQLMNEVWGYDYIGDSNIVDVYIRYLRHKIDDTYQIKTIHTIRSVGYLFSYEENEASE